MNINLDGNALLETLERRLEAAEAQRDTAWGELREIRRLIEADENEATSDEVRRVVAERKEARRQLEQAQRETQNASEIIEGAYVVLGNGDFKNGNTDPSGYIDEGDVYAGKQFELMRQWLLVHPTIQNYIKFENVAPIDWRES